MLKYWIDPRAYVLFRTLLSRYPIGSIDAVRTYCAQHTELCLVSDTSWVSTQRVLGLVPSDVRERADRLIAQKHYLEFQDSAYVHLMHILGYQGAGTLPPLGYIRDEIVRSIVGKRKRALSKALEEDIWSESRRSYDFQVYQ